MSEPHSPNSNDRSADAIPVWGRPNSPQAPPIDIGAGGQTIDPSLDPSTGGGDGRSGGKRLSTMAKTLTAVAVAAVIAVGGTIAVTSANASNSSTSSTGQPGGSGGAAQVGAAGGPGGFGGSGTGPGGGSEMSVIGSALHGEFVVADGTATATERVQTGALTTVSSTGITVRSTDGFTATYVVGTGLDVTAFTTGTDVTVIAKVSGTTVTATAVTAARTGDDSVGRGQTG